MTAEDRDDADDEKWCAERRTEVIDYLAPANAIEIVEGQWAPKRLAIVDDRRRTLINL
jgi:hypothetical protein